MFDKYVRNTWKKYGIVRAMMNSNGLFFFKFSSVDGMNRVLENGHWFIRSVPIILKKWTPNANLLKEDLCSIHAWVKLHDIPILAFTKDELSAMATKLGNPIMLDYYTSSMCMQSWGRLNYTRALLDIRADRELKYTMVIAISSLEGNGDVLHTVRMEYEWKPPRCEVCMVFGHDDMTCLQRVFDEGKKQNMESNVGFQYAPKKKIWPSY